ncbi:DUF523 domain-containing protein [Christensenellaceae bacterium OttesenSCG-928-L17]|nr:DUF523 domain-containing protein [Christensenellaceae bacterium OttesenSCG-928-L17]
MILVSACLAGKTCRYNHSAAADARIVELVRAGKALAACPEVLGGLSTPRPPAELQHGDGYAVLLGQAEVKTADGACVTEAFIKGAQETLRLCRVHGVTTAILKANSPSCGCGKIYDGTFTGKLIDGVGVTAALLIQNGIAVDIV